MKKIAIVVGHNARSQGAVGAGGVTEFAFNSQLAPLIVDALRDAGHAGKVFNRQPRRSYSAQIRKVYGETDAWGADATIELHFNAAANDRATGCLTLSSGTDGSMALARAVHPAMRDVMGNEDDGIRTLSHARAGRGALSLWSGRAPAILVEPFFGRHPGMMDRAFERLDVLAEAIALSAIIGVGGGVAVAA